MSTKKYAAREAQLLSARYLFACEYELTRRADSIDVELINPWVGDAQRPLCVTVTEHNVLAWLTDNETYVLIDNEAEAAQMHKLFAVGDFIAVAAQLVSWVGRVRQIIEDDEIALQKCA